MTTIVIFAAIVLIGGFIYLKTSAKNTAETIANIVEEAKEVQAEAQAEVEKAAKPKKKSAPRKKKETASATEGPIKGEYYKQPR
jgi:Sec-independent protein translocase protein TatA